MSSNQEYVQAKFPTSPMKMDEWLLPYVMIISDLAGSKVIDKDERPKFNSKTMLCKVVGCGQHRRYTHDQLKNNKFWAAHLKWVHGITKPEPDDNNAIDNAAHGIVPPDDIAVKTPSVEPSKNNAVENTSNKQEEEEETAEEEEENDDDSESSFVNIED